MNAFKCGTVTTKVCSSCKQELPSYSFHASKDRRDGMQRSCKKCQAKQAAAWRAKNKLRHRELSRASHARKHGYTPEAWSRLQYLKQVQAATAQQIKEITSHRVEKP